MTTKQDPYIAKVAKAFGYDYDYAAKRIGRAANIRHLRPSTLAKEIYVNDHTFLCTDAFVFDSGRKIRKYLSVF